MANIYVRSTDGSDSDNGSTWALAKASVDNVDGAASIDSAGDTIWLSQDHAESTAGAVSIALASTQATPGRLLCGNDAAEPPTALATGASVTTTGANNLTVTGSVYVYGITFIAGAALALNNAAATSSYQIYEACSFQVTAAGSSGQIVFNSTGNAILAQEHINCTYKFANAANYIIFGGRAVLRGCSIVSGSTTPSSLFRVSTDRTPAVVSIDGCDFSNLSGGVILFAAGAGQLAPCTITVRNCKLPSSWSGTLLSAAPNGLGQRYEMFNCDDGDTNYALWVEDYAGSIRDETTIVRDGGASDGTTSFSWKMVTTANAEYRLIVLRSPEIRYWNETTGSAITLTVEVVHDSQGSGTSSAFTDKEIWLEAQYLGTSGFPLGSFIDDAAADVLASAADQTSSSVTWTTTGLSTPVKQKLSVTLTPEEKGVILLTVCMAGASDTCYVCPKVTVS